VETRQLWDLLDAEYYVVSTMSSYAHRSPARIKDFVKWNVWNLVEWAIRLAAPDLTESCHASYNRERDGERERVGVLCEIMNSLCSAAFFVSARNPETESAPLRSDLHALEHEKVAIQ